MKIKAGIIGGAGYTGGELVRILINHPHAEIIFIHSKSHAGKNISSIHADLAGETDLQFIGNDSPLTKKNWGNIEVLFLCVGHHEAKNFLEENNLPEKIKNY